MADFNPLFPPTRWTMVALLGAEKSGKKETAWNELAKVYQPALIRFLRSRQVSESDAQDLVQGLFLKLWKNHQTSAPLGPSRGSLRSYLLQSLLNFQRGHFRDSRRKKRSGALPDLDFDNLPQLASEVSPPDDTSTFDQEWAAATIRSALKNLAASYAARDATPIFHACLQLLQDDDPALRRELCTRLQVEANSLTVSFKRFRTRLGKIIRATISETLVNPSDFEIDTEVRNLLRAFEATGGFLNLSPAVSL